MKTMTCKQLGGACELEFRAETFEEIGKMSQEHGKEMFETQEPAHLEAMNAMFDLMQNPEALKQWMDDRKAEFDALPHT